MPPSRLAAEKTREKRNFQYPDWMMGYHYISYMHQKYDKEILQRSLLFYYFNNSEEMKTFLETHKLSKLLKMTQKI